MKWKEEENKLRRREGVISPGIQLRNLAGEKKRIDGVLELNSQRESPYLMGRERIGVGGGSYCF